MVLVANRIDSRDDERMADQKNSLTVKARLSKAVLHEKLKSSDIKTEMEREHLQLWFLTSRLVFGEESISCRLVAPVLNALRGHKQSSDLTKILLAKLPTISLVAAEQFVAAFLSHLEGSCLAGNPFSLLFKVAALERDHDEDTNAACSFPEFMTLLPRHIYEAPPFLRLMCWCAYITHLRRTDGEEIVSWQINVASFVKSGLGLSVAKLGTVFEQNICLLFISI